MSRDVTPEAVLQLQDVASGFLCPMEANVFGIDFLDFSIRDQEGGRTLFAVSREEGATGAGPAAAAAGAAAALAEADQVPLDPEVADKYRSIDYVFPIEFLDLRTVVTKLRFRVGSQPVRNFRMIERHFFKGRLLRTYDFVFPFCPPDSVNEWETVYEVPVLDPELRDDMANTPNGVQSDTFYFVENKLVMHNRARYSYVR